MIMARLVGHTVDYSTNWQSLLWIKSEFAISVDINGIREGLLGPILPLGIAPDNGKAELIDGKVA